MYHLVIFIDLAYLEPEETEMLAVFLHMQMSSVLNQALTHLSNMITFGPFDNSSVILEGSHTNSGKFP